MKELSVRICDFISKHKNLKGKIKETLINKGIKKIIALCLDDINVLSTLPYRELAIIAYTINEVYGEAVFPDVNIDDNLYTDSVFACTSVIDLKDFYYTHINSTVVQKLLNNGVIYTSFPYDERKIPQATALTCLDLKPIALTYRENTDVVYRGNTIYIKTKVFMPYDSALSFMSLSKIGVTMEVPILILPMLDFSKSRYQYYCDYNIETRVIKDINEICGCDIIKLFEINAKHILFALRNSNRSYEETIHSIADSLLLVKQRYNLEYAKQMFAQNRNDVVVDMMNRNFERWNK